MILLHPYSPLPQYEPRQRQTKKAIERFKNEFDIKIIDVECESERVLNGAYENALRDNWGLDDLVTLEQDLAPTNSMLRGLMECDKPICAQEYEIHKCLIVAGKETGIDWCIAHYVPYGCFRILLEPATFDEQPKWRWASAADEYADMGYLGFTRFSLSWQRNNPLTPMVLGTWADLDERIAKFAYERKMPYHIHRPLCQHHDNQNEGHNVFKRYNINVSNMIPYPSDAWNNDARRQLMAYLRKEEPQWLPSNTGDWRK